MIYCNRFTTPGGYCEFKDWDFIPTSPDDSMAEGSYLVQYHALVREAVEKLGKPSVPGPRLKKWVEDAGFVNVQEQILPVPLGLWPRDKKWVR
jgi:hypothetical protein